MRIPIFCLNLPGVAITSPFILSDVILSSISVKTLIDLLNIPGLFSDLYATVINPFSPAFISSVDQLGVVQPQPAFTCTSLNGASPVFEK